MTDAIAAKNHRNWVVTLTCNPKPIFELFSKFLYTRISRKGGGLGDFFHEIRIDFFILSVFWDSLQATHQKRG